MSAEDLMHEYAVKTGGIPPHVAQLVELEQRLGGKFIFKPEFDASIARMWVGLAENLPRKLQGEERLRLANFLRREGKISNEELASLGMRAIVIPTLLERIHGLDGS